MSFQKYIPREEADSINVWICEDHAELRRATSDIVSRAAGMHCPVAVGSMEKIIRELEDSSTRKPDVLLLDLGLPGMSGFDGIDAVKTRVPDCKIIIYTVSGDDRNTFGALKNGVDGYLVKGDSITGIPDAIRDVVEGKPAVCAETMQLILDRFQSKKFEIRNEENPYGLTENEKSILLLCSHGMIKKDIVEAVGLSYHRVDYYIRMIFKKLNVTTIHGAVGKALRRGIVSETWPETEETPFPHNQGGRLI